MNRLRNGGKIPTPAGKTSALALSGLLLVAPIMGAGCDSGRDMPQNARTEVSCNRSESKVKVGWMELSVKGHCTGEEVDNVDIKMPCGSRRFQESCTLKLPVPGTASIVRGRDSARIEIVVTDNGNGAAVEINRKNI
ncbi:MAG: hypothetical protein V1861_01750 [Candidatus Micrarchaeota archaeon]